MTDCVAVNRGPVTSGIAVTDAEGESALQMSGLCVDLAGRRVLHDVDLSIDRGELAALVGPNGAGKTTLLRSILGLQRISGGGCMWTGGRRGPDEYRSVTSRSVMTSPGTFPARCRGSS